MWINQYLGKEKYNMIRFFVTIKKILKTEYLSCSEDREDRI